MRTNFFSRVVAALFAMALTMPVSAEEKNGLLVTVAKKTLDKNDVKSYGSTTVSRTQGLALTVKNTSIRDFPAGEVQWTIVVRKSYGSYHEKYSGKEVLKALRPSSTAELVFGAVPMGGYRSDSSNSKDKLEYEVVIVHNGKETIRASSDPNFTLLAKRANSMDRHADDDGERPRRSRIGEDVPTIPGVVPPGLMPPGLTPPVPVRPDMPPKPIADNTPKPGTPPTPPAAPTPATTPTVPPTPEPPPPAAEPAKPFDFFNLDKKK